MLEAQELEWFFANPDLYRYEFLGGDNPNKRRWTDTATEYCTVFIQRSGLHMAPADLQRFTLPDIGSRLRNGFRLGR